MFPLSEKVKTPDLTREKKSYAQAAKINSKNTSAKLQKEKEIHAHVVVVPETAKVNGHRAQ